MKYILLTFSIFRKVAKVLQNAEKSNKRKSDSPISELVGSEDVIKEKRSVMTSPVAVQSTSAQTENTAPGAGTDDGEVSNSVNFSLMK